MSFKTSRELTAFLKQQENLYDEATKNWARHKEKGKFKSRSALLAYLETIDDKIHEAEDAFDQYNRREEEETTYVAKRPTKRKALEEEDKHEVEDSWVPPNVALKQTRYLTEKRILEQHSTIWYNDSLLTEDNLDEKSGILANRFVDEVVKFDRGAGGRSSFRIHLIIEGKRRIQTHVSTRNIVVNFTPGFRREQLYETVAKSISYELKDFVNQYHGGDENESETWPFIHSMKATIRPFSASGGCHSKPKTVPWNEGYNLYSPASANNNCAIMALNYSTGHTGITNNCTAFRKKLNILPGIEIDYKELPRMLDALTTERGLRVVNENNDVLIEHNLEKGQVIELALVDSHYYVIVPKATTIALKKAATEKKMENKFAKNFMERKIHENLSVLRPTDHLAELNYETANVFAWYIEYKQEIDQPVEILKSEFGDQVCTSIDETIPLLANLSNSVVVLYDMQNYVNRIRDALHRQSLKPFTFGKKQIYYVSFGANNIILDMRNFMKGQVKCAADIKLLFREINELVYKQHKFNIVNVDRDGQVDLLSKSVARKFYMTPGGIAMSGWSPPCGVIGTNDEQFARIQKSIRYARVGPNVEADRDFNTQCEDLSYEGLKASGDYLKSIDWNSFYMCAMCNKVLTVRYPVGNWYESKTPKEDFEEGKVGIYTISAIHPSTLRTTTVPSRNKFRVQEIKSEDFTNVDVQNLLDLGYEVQFEGDCLVNDTVEEKLFDEFIETWYNEKVSWPEKSNRYNFAKAVGLSLWGKASQSKKTVERGIVHRYVSTEAEYLEFEKQYDIIDSEPVYGEDQMLYMTGRKLGTESATPSKQNFKHLQAWIFSYTRALWTILFKVADPTLTEVFGYYYATDAVYLTAKQFDNLEKAGWIKPKDNKAPLGCLSEAKIENAVFLIHKAKFFNHNQYIYWFVDCNNEQSYDDRASGFVNVKEPHYDGQVHEIEMEQDSHITDKNITEQDEERGIKIGDVVKRKVKKRFKAQ